MHPSRPNALVFHVFYSQNLYIKQTLGYRIRNFKLYPHLYNLFLGTPFESVNLWVAFARQLRATQWGDHNLPHVIVREHVQCAGCHGHTHFYWACPFLKVPGWHGRMPDSVRAKMEGRASGSAANGSSRNGKENAGKNNRFRA